MSWDAQGALAQIAILATTASARQSCDGEIAKDAQGGLAQTPVLAATAPAQDIRDARMHQGSPRGPCADPVLTATPPNGKAAMAKSLRNEGGGGAARGAHAVDSLGS